MTAVLSPRVRTMVICDAVRELRDEPGVFNLRGVRQEVNAVGFPFALARLSLFLVLASPRPDMYPGYVRVVNDRTDKAVFYSHLSPAPRFGGTRDFLSMRVHLSCVFPTPDRYTIQVCFFQEHGSDVIKGELPFHVVQSGG